MGDRGAGYKWPGEVVLFLVGQGCGYELFVVMVA